MKKKLHFSLLRQVVGGPERTAYEKLVKFPFNSLDLIQNQSDLRKNSYQLSWAFTEALISGKKKILLQFYINES